MSNIRENLLKMKDMSETMLDLSYSAVFLHDNTLADQVKGMYKEMQKLEDETLKILFKIDEEDEERIGIVDLAGYIKEVGAIAMKISQLSATEEFEEIARAVLGETDERVFSSVVKPQSSVANKSLALSKLRTKTKARIVCVKRNNKWVSKINKDTILRPDDFLVAVGDSSAQELFKKIVSDTIDNL